MIFTSYTYLLFLLVVFFLHWLAPKSWRKVLLIVASYAFYCTWKWQFGFLLLGLSLFNWAYGRWVLPRSESSVPLVVGVIANLSSLIYFKYTSFLLVNTAAALQLFGSAWHPSVGDIILPLGISFFTFQGIAYLFDVATGEPPLEGLVDFLLFKAFWPQLIAGPIIRLHEIREQIASDRRIVYSDFAAGSQRILFGFFKKIVVADNLAPYVDMVFLSQSAPNFLDAGVGILGFGLQIYFDFSAYSDIAIGTARLFGFTFPENFNWPYVSASPQEFWNRWHMTLSRWIRDYVFTPLSFAGRRRPRMAPLWLLIAMAICGLWHGAQWTFILWGIWHGLLMVLQQTSIGKALFTGESSNRGAGHRLFSQALTFVLVMAGWLLFRARSVGQAAVFAHSILTVRGGMHPAIIRENIVLLLALLMAAVIVAQALRARVARWFYSTGNSEAVLAWVRPIVYACIILAIVIFDQESKAFVYFQF